VYDGKIAWYKNCITLNTISPIVCTEYTSPSGNYTWTSTGTYTDKIPVTGGCDSVITINLTVQNAYKEQICMVTVDTLTGQNLVVWEPTENVGTEEYIIHREGIIAGSYNALGIVPASNLTVYVDATANPMSEPYKYKITTKDTCGNYSSIDSCDYHKTIHLQTSLGSPNGYQLQWTEYEGFPYSTYNIYGRETGLGAFTLVHQSAYGINSWTDGTTAPNMEYRIAVEKSVPCLNDKTSGGPYSHSLSNLDDYSIGGTDVYGCTDSTASNYNSLATIDDGSCNHDSVYIETVTDFNNIKIYPNPNSGIFTISGNDITKIEITDLNGKAIIIKEDITEFNNIDLRKQAKGVYIVKILINEIIIIMRKVVIE